jgi:septum site-determining protein MinC
MVDVHFQLKGSVITVVVLELKQYDPATFSGDLQAKVDAAPQFFVNSPVLINLEKLANPDAIASLEPLAAQCRELGLLPVGFAAVPPSLLPLATETGLACLPPPGERASKMPAAAEPEPEAGSPDSAETAPTLEVESPAPRPSLVITRPVRSGQQVYSDGDLIVLSQVSEGAEVLADGHIHVYGALRGRALAGVRGDTSARIFCQSMEAELVSVAGNFVLQDGVDAKLLKQPAQIFLAGENLCVEPL